MPLDVSVTTSGSVMCRLKDLRKKGKEDKWFFLLVYPFHQGDFPGTLVGGSRQREVMGLWSSLPSQGDSGQAQSLETQNDTFATFTGSGLVSRQADSVSSHVPMKSQANP